MFAQALRRPPRLGWRWCHNPYRQANITLQSADQGLLAQERGEADVDGWQVYRIGREEVPQGGDVRQLACIKDRGQPLCQFPLAARSWAKPGARQ